MPHSPSTRDTPAILPGIQLLRGLSALLVVATHANLILRKPEYLKTTAVPAVLRESGQFGVAIFFVISGFIIALVSLRADLSPRLSRREFARRRFVRIVPFLWTCVIGYNLLSYAGTHAVDWPSFARAFFVWPVGEMKPNVVWSLRHEFLFYTLFAIFMIRPERRVWPLVAWFLAPLICWPVLLLAGISIPAAPDGWLELFQVVFLGSQGGANLQFGAGFLLGLLMIRHHPIVAPRWRGLVLPCLATLATALIVDLTNLPVGPTRSVAWTLLAIVPAWLAIVSVSERGALHWLGRRLGDSSFALYLVHNPVLLVLFAIGVKLHVLAAIWFLPAVVLIAALTGYAAHLLVEKPLIDWLAHGRPLAPWLRRRARSAPPSAGARDASAD